MSFNLSVYFCSYLLEGARLVGIHAGRYYKRSDGLALGPGMFLKGLEYAAGCEATIVGKPNKTFFLSAIGDFKPEECVMIGDVSSIKYYQN